MLHFRNRASSLFKFAAMPQFSPPHFPSAAPFATVKPKTRIACDASTASPFRAVRIKCRRNVADMLSEALLCFGASSASMDVCSSDTPDEINISSIFIGDQDLYSCISQAAGSIGLKEILSYEVTAGEDCDWVKASQENFQPVKVTDELWIVPAWRTPPNINARNVTLNPGLAFGTGEHPTTKLCLLMLYRLIKGGETFLDYGAGSGILSIAALKLGAALAVGVDIDPQAITSARQNAVLNGIGHDKLQLFLGSHEVSLHLSEGRMDNDFGDLSPNDIGIYSGKEKHDIVIANILLNPLLELAEQIVACAKPGAVIGLSGIISEQIQQVEECYSKYLDNITVSEMDGWACISGTKKKV